MVLEFYYDNRSQPCRAVYLFLKGSGVAFEPKVTDLMKGQHREPEFVKKNPYHKVPLIDDDGFVLAESVAIMRYIAIKFNVADHWFPRKDLQKAAKIDEFLNWQHLNIRKPDVQIFVNMFLSRVEVSEVLKKKPLDVELVTTAKEELTKAITHIADYYLKDQPYICGEEISAADLIGVCELMQLTGVNESGLFESNATVKAWVKRVEERMQPHFAEALINLNGMKKMWNEAKP